jgi:hypothetical protein
MAVMALAGLLPFASPLVARWTLRHIDQRAAQKAAQAQARAEARAKKAERAGRSVPRQAEAPAADRTETGPRDVPAGS